MRIILLAAALLAAPAPPSWSQVTITGEARVVDGDTLDLGPVRIRLHGVDAPERAQTCAAPRGTWNCGAAAAARLAALVGTGAITCRPVERDAFGRIVATCAAAHPDLGAALVAEGLAWAFARYSDLYVAVEAEAKAVGVGVWRADTPPAWEWRETAWTAASGEAPAGCPIKGNITRAGERIYHPPWSAAYSRTEINETYGERWFCDEAEAVAAGWRAPL